MRQYVCTCACLGVPRRRAQNMQCLCARVMCARACMAGRCTACARVILVLAQALPSVPFCKANMTFRSKFQKTWRPKAPPEDLPAAAAASSAGTPPPRGPGAEAAARPELPPGPRGKAVPESWPPWIARTAQTLERGRAALPKGTAVPQALAPAVPSAMSSTAPYTQRLKKHLLYRYSEAAVRATSFRPERWTVYCLGRPVQAPSSFMPALRCVW